MNINTGVTGRSNNTTPNQDTSPQSSRTEVSRDNGNVATTDSVTLSETARLLDSAATYPEPDSQRIAELKYAINAGSYTIDSMRIAEKLHQFNINL